MKLISVVLGTDKGQQVEARVSATEGMAMKHTNRKNISRVSRIMALAVGLGAWGAGSAQAIQCDGDWNLLYTNYNQFAIVNVWGQLDTLTGMVDFETGYGPSEDKDGDGLTNLQEFNGWSAIVNGRVQWFTWNKTRANATNWAGCGPDPEEFDTDCDGISDQYEFRYTGTNPQNGDTDGDGIVDPIEVYAGLNPRDAGWSAYTTNGLPRPGALPTGENPLMDPDGDGMSTVEELPAATVIPGCASASTFAFPTAALSNAFWTSPLDYDTDDDRLIDSFERKYGDKFNALVAEPEPLNMDTDLDKDGLVNFREQTIHPLLGNYWSSMTRTDPPTPFDTYPIPRLVNSTIGVRFPQRPEDRGDGLYMPNYMNKANFDGAPKQSGAFSLNTPIPLPAGVRWGHPFGSNQEYLEFVSVLSNGTVRWETLKGVERWTKPADSDSDDDGLPDGWEVEHGLNPWANNPPVGTAGSVTGARGDPDQDTLVNYQEYFGQDGIRIDLVTGTGDELNPWIARVVNYGALSAFGSRAGQVGYGTRGEQAPSSYALRFTRTYRPDLYPGFFDPTATRVVTNTVFSTNSMTDTNVVVTNWYPVVGVPAFPDANDMIELVETYDQGVGGFLAVTNGSFQPFATSMDGFLYAEPAGAEDGRYTPGTDSLWVAVSAPGFFTPASAGPPVVVADPILADPAGLLTTNPVPGHSIVDNIPLKYPMPGTDSDDDHWPDALEIQMDVRKGRPPTSPVQSHNPLVPRAARVIGDEGMTVNSVVASRQYFAANFTVEAWVYLEPEVGNNTFEGSFIRGNDFIGLRTFDLGVKTINGFDTVPYIEMQTLGGKVYRAAAARSLPLGQWVHLAGVFGRNQNSLTLYINGLVEQALQVVEDGASFRAATASPGGSLVFALPNTNVCSFADRLWLDEVRIWGVPRTPQEIADNRSRLIDPVQVTDPAVVLYEEENPLFAYFSFDDGGTTAEDLVRRAKCSLYGNLYPYDLTVSANLDHEYLYHDQFYGINSDEIGGAFQFDANNPAPVRGTLDSIRGEFDSDGDSLPDSWEIVHQLNPFTPYTPDHNDMSARYDPAWGEMSPVIVERTGYVYRASINAGITWLETTAPQVAVINGPEIIITPCPNCIIAYILRDPNGPVEESNMSWTLKVGQVTYIQDGQRWYVTDEGLPVKQVTYGGGSNINWVADALRDPDGDGLNNQFEYWSQTNPNRSDTDEDGRMDGEEDFDGDGLVNRLESDLGSRPDLRDTDDDGIMDSVEQADETSPVDSASPDKRIALYLDGKPGSYLHTPDRYDFRLRNWTVEAKILPARLSSLADGQGASIVRRTVQDTTNDMLAANFDLRVVRLGTNLTAEARYIFLNENGQGEIVSVRGTPGTHANHRLVVAANATDPYPSDGFMHLAATFNDTTAELNLYLDGALLASSNFPALSRPLQSGKGARSFVRIGENFEGFVDDIRIWALTRTSSEIYNDMNTAALTASGLVARFALDDGGWPATLTRASVISAGAVPPASGQDDGDRYLISVGATGAWAGRVNEIAEWQGTYWTFTTPVLGMRILNAGTSTVMEWNGAAWVAASNPVFIRGVDSLGAPAAVDRLDGVSWLAGANIVTIDSGLQKTSPAPAQVFSEGAMVAGAAAAGDFAWWNSKAEYYRFIGGQWLRWGPALRWLAPVRLKVDGIYATTNALVAAAGARVIGERFVVVAEGAIYTAMSEDGSLAENFATEPLNVDDRILAPAPYNAVMIWDGSTLNTLATASELGGGLYVLVRSQGIAYRSDGVTWSHWSMIPSSEDATVERDWNSQWSRAAWLSGNGSFRMLEGELVLGKDTDGDGLPDDWEITNGLDENDPAGDNGAAGDPDGDGLSNLWEYRLGYDPQDHDSNNNGLNDGEEDFDRDGLPNWYEQDLTLTRLDQPDTDDDGLTDYEEAIGHGTAQRTSDPLWSLDPPTRRSMEFKGNSRLTVAAQARHHLKSWSVMAWVKPAADTATNSLILRRTLKSSNLQYAGPDLVNYELGLREAEPGLYAPYVRHVGLVAPGNGLDPDLPVEAVVSVNDSSSTNETKGGHQATGLIAAGEWAHLAGTYDAETHTMSLYINGELSVYRNDVFPPSGMDLGTETKKLGTLTIGGGAKSGGVVEKPFKGFLDDVKILDGASGANQIQYEASKQIAGTLTTLDVSVDPDVHQLPIAEALQFEHTNSFVLVRFKSGAPQTAPADTAAALGLTVNRSYKLVPIHRLAVPAGVNLATKLAELRADANVLYAEPDYILRPTRTPNDTMFYRQWGLNNTAVPDADISAIEAWNQTTGNGEIIVAVIDTGVDYNHPDLAGNMWVNSGEIPDNRIDDDNNGYIDDYHGWNFSTIDTLIFELPPSDPIDYAGHGTHCAGILGAMGNNALGVAGVNWKVKIMPVNFLGQLGLGFTSDAILALEYAWQNGARISNNSWGGGAESQALKDAIQMAGYKGHLFVAAAGNAGTDNDVAPFFPASYDLPNIVSVAATDMNDNLADFSCFGKTSVDLAAPGVGILSTLPNGQYGNSDGTSMAAPFVTGAAALLLSRNDAMEPMEIKRILLQSVDELDALKGKLVSNGRLNLAKVVGGSQVLKLPFDDGGATAEDFTTTEDWNSLPVWEHAAVRDNTMFSTSSYIPLFEDSDSDGMPDWWEEAMGLDPLRSGSLNGAAGDPDNDGLNNYYEYLAGTNPFDKDTDHDGITDFNADSDGDGLSNGQEQQAGTLPGSLWIGPGTNAQDTDDDGVADPAEITAGTDPLDAGAPDFARAMAFHGSGRLMVGTEHQSDANLAWTIEAWVKPVGTGTNGVILRRAEKHSLAGQEWVDYELGLDGMVPYVSYAFRAEGGSHVAVRVDAPKALPMNQWTHLAAVRDPGTLQTRLYVNAKVVATESAARLPAASLRGVFETVMGEGLVGELDAIRSWHYARSGVEIQNNRDVLLPEANLSGDPDKNRAPKRLFNFDDGGSSAENSYFRNDWMSGWQNAATLEGDAHFVDSSWPPMDLDSDDDASTDVDERSNNTLVLRSESPYRSRALKFSGLGGVLGSEQVDGKETMLYAVSNWTVEAWVKPDAHPTSAVSLVKRETLGGGSATFELGLDTNLSVYAGFNRTDAGHLPYRVTSGTKVLMTNEWVHLAATYSQLENRLILYINGIEQIRGTDTSARPVMDRAARLLLGAPGFIGELKEVRIWNKARAPADVYATYGKTLLFSAALLENSFHGTGALGNQSYLGRATEAKEDGYVADHTTILLFGDEYRALSYTYGRQTHKFTLETWIRMEPGAKGGRAVTRQVDVMLVDRGADWRINEAIVITNGAPTVEWWGQVNTATPIYEEEDVPDPRNPTNTIKRKVLNRLEYTTEIVRRSLVSEVDLRDGEWHHLAAVGDGERVRLYVDGELDTESLSYYVFKAKPAPSFETFYWQYHNAGSALRIGDSTLQADLDEVMVWNEDRSPEEIQRHMKYGLTAKEVEASRLPISPVPEFAIDDGEDHVDLVSYMIFDGMPPLPFVVDAANEGMNYRILPDVSGDELLRNSRPPVFVDRLRAMKDDLAGYFAADDGGESAENFMERNNLDAAGLLIGDAQFVTAPSTVTQADTDGDGLPDWWEEAHDLDAGNPDGVDGAYGDADHDGLSNLAEYLAGTDPNNWDTDGDGLSDYDDSACPTCPSNGEYYMDGDQIPDAWEILYPEALSPLVNDAFTDPDGDGWRNLAEYLGKGYEFAAITNTGNTQTRYYNAVSPTKPDDTLSYPAPAITFTFLGDCTPPPDAKLYVQAFSDPMLRRPDAEHTVSNRFVNGLAETIELWNGGKSAGVGDGHVRQGSNIFMAFIDVNDDGVWNAGEWMGYSEAENIQWGSAQVTIGLTDKPAGYIRFSWAQDMDKIAAGLAQVNSTTYIVAIKALSQAGQPIIYSTTRGLESMARPYITEMDLRAAGIGPLNGSYQWTVATADSVVYAVGTNTLVYPASLATPTILAPANVTVAHAQNTLRLGLSADAAQITVQILRGGTTVHSATLPAPYVGNSGVAEMTLPWLAGWGSFTNGDYTIRVTAVNPRVSSGTASAAFSVNLQEAPVGAGTIKGKVGYFGTNSGNRIVEAFMGAGFDQTAVSRARVASNSTYVLLGLRPGTYSIRGFVDRNGNGTLDDGEPWGFVKALQTSGNVLARRTVPGRRAAPDPESPYAVEYRVKTVEVAAQGSALLQDMVAYDSLAYRKNSVDSDGDGLPDDVELALGTSPVVWDSDFDNLGDAAEEALGSNPANPDTDGDAMPDGWENAYTNCGLRVLISNAGADADGDGLANELEYLHGTNPCNPDTDGDGLRDDYEVFHNLNPRDPADANADADQDGRTNKQEQMDGTDPNRSDSDQDGLNDGAEAAAGTNPLDWDSDNDGFSDGVETELGTDPLDPLEFPTGMTAQTHFERITRSGGTATVVYTASDLTGSPVILDFEENDNLTNEEAWAPVGVQRVINAAGQYTNMIVDPDMDDRLNIRIRTW